MHLKRYEVTDMGEAIAQIKRDLGPDAIILSTRTLHKRRGLFGLGGKPLLEVIAAVDPQSGEDVTQAVAGASRRAEYVTPPPSPLTPREPLSQEASTAEMEALRKELRSMREELQTLQGTAKDPAPT